MDNEVVPEASKGAGNRPPKPAKPAKPAELKGMKGSLSSEAIMITTDEIKKDASHLRSAAPSTAFTTLGSPVNRPPVPIKNLQLTSNSSLMANSEISDNQESIEVPKVANGVRLSGLRPPSPSAAEDIDGRTQKTEVNAIEVPKADQESPQLTSPRYINILAPLAEPPPASPSRPLPKKPNLNNRESKPILQTRSIIASHPSQVYAEIPVVPAAADATADTYSTSSFSDSATLKAPSNASLNAPIEASQPLTLSPIRSQRAATVSEMMARKPIVPLPPISNKPASPIVYRNTVEASIVLTDTTPISPPNKEDLKEKKDEKQKEKSKDKSKTKDKDKEKEKEKHKDKEKEKDKDSDKEKPGNIFSKFTGVFKPRKSHTRDGSSGTDPGDNVNSEDGDSTRSLDVLTESHVTVSAQTTPREGFISLKPITESPRAVGDGSSVLTQNTSFDNLDLLHLQLAALDAEMKAIEYQKRLLHLAIAQAYPSDTAQESKYHISESNVDSKLPNNNPSSLNADSPLSIQRHPDAISTSSSSSSLTVAQTYSSASSHHKTSKSDSDLISSPFNVVHTFHASSNIEWSGSEGPESSFAFLKKVGQTQGHGSTYLAKHKISGFQVIIKALPKIPANIEQAIAGNLKRYAPFPHLASCYSVAPTSSELWIIREYFALGSSKDIFDNHALTEDQVGTIARTLVAIVEELHRKDMAHGDIKPSNIFFSATGELRLSEHGLIEMMQNLSHSKDHPYYAPEYFLDGHDHVKADVWSIGITIAELMEAKQTYTNSEASSFSDSASAPLSPAPSETLESGNPISNYLDKLDTSKWSPNLIDFVRSCLQTDPMQRSTTAELLRLPFLQNRDSKTLLDIVANAVALNHASYDLNWDHQPNLNQTKSTRDFADSRFDANCSDWPHDQNHEGSISSYSHSIFKRPAAIQDISRAKESLMSKLLCYEAKYLESVGGDPQSTSTVSAFSKDIQSLINDFFDSALAQDQT